MPESEVQRMEMIPVRGVKIEEKLLAKLLVDYYAVMIHDLIKSGDMVGATDLVNFVTPFIDREEDRAFFNRAAMLIQSVKASKNLIDQMEKELKGGKKKDD